MRYWIILEQSVDGFGAYVPDLPGCIAAGESEAEVLTLIEEAIIFHLDALKAQGQDIPMPQSSARLLEISA